MLKAYVDLMSQPSRAVYIFLKYTKIPHTVVPVALRKGEHMQAEYAKNVNAFKLVPVIHDGDFVLPESVAILKYLSLKHNLESLYPKDLQLQARIDAFMNWQHLNLRFGGSAVFQALFIQPVMTGKPIDYSKVDMGMKVMKASLKKMENIFLKDTPYLNSPTMSIADILGVCEVMQPRLGLGLDFSTEFPKVAQWSERVRESVGTELFDEAHTFLTIAGQKFQSSDVPKPKL